MPDLPKEPRPPKHEQMELPIKAGLNHNPENSFKRSRRKYNKRMKGITSPDIQKPTQGELSFGVNRYARLRKSPKQELFEERCLLRGKKAEIIKEVIQRTGCNIPYIFEVIFNKFIDCNDLKFSENFIKNPHETIINCWQENYSYLLGKSKTNTVIDVIKETEFKDVQYIQNIIRSKFDSLVFPLPEDVVNIENQAEFLKFLTNPVKYLVEYWNSNKWQIIREDEAYKKILLARVSHKIAWKNEAEKNKILEEGLNHFLQEEDSDFLDNPTAKLIEYFHQKIKPKIQSWQDGYDNY